ncbi:DMT family transporter [Streptosporangium sp. KLBMP 9127]|nr:DMT family transporter [Streptosporangium sp. KLBMP 9127]
MTVLAACVALLGSLFFALGAAVQQFEAARSAEQGLLRLARRPRWLLGGVSILTGGALHIVALSLGPLTVVQPMGVASLLFALPIAAALHGRKPQRTELVAAATVAAGLIGLVLIVPEPSGPTSLSSSGALTLLAIAAVVAVLLWLAARPATPSVRAGLLAMASGVLYGATATLTRVIVDGTWEPWFFLAVPLPALIALALLQRAYAVGHFGVAFSVLQVADPLTAVAFGAILLGEPLPTGTASLLTAFAAMLLAGAGTVALARTTPLHHTH